MENHVAHDRVPGLNFPHPDPVGDDLAGGGEDQGVEIGGLRAPQAGCRDGEPGVVGVVGAAGEGFQYTSG